MIYVTGDIHGDITRFNDRELKKLKAGDYLIICGDFGFLWNKSEEEQKALEKLAKKKYTIMFVDGAHENFDILSQTKLTRYKGGYAHKIAENVYHMMRGEIFELDGKTVFAMGGGESYDRELRTEGESWWRDEIPSRDELANGAENLDSVDCKVDIVITHEAPAKTKEFLRLKTNETVKITPLNSYLDTMAANISYKHWYFGSLHMDLPITNNMTSVFKEIVPVEF